jgi:nicotinamidase-related amidase
MNRSATRLRSEESVVAVIDIQTRLLSAIPTAEMLVRNASFLLDVAALLEVPVIGTEQYPKGLGPTTQEVAQRIPRAITSKTTFSSCGVTEFSNELRNLGRSTVVLVGMETHVCVQQTALDLYAAGYSVFLPVDTLASRAQIDHDIALRRMERAGAVLTTCEAIAFEWLTDSKHLKFKAVSKLVIERSSASRSVANRR